jgi:hypothetical protein
MTFHGHIHNGTIVLDEATSLPEGAQVVVSVLAPPENPTPTVLPTLLERLSGVVGRAENVPADFSIEHDKYIDNDATP